ncbi:MAG: radical SAM protein [Candidatus Staskawiczbacteria bacterium]|jgi:MoaA/NifB/PqqE/SkfB family radical SAM enzyme
MSVKERLKASSINQMVRFLPHLSDDRIIKITELVEKIVPEESKILLKQIRELFKTHPLSLVYTKRVVAGVNSKCRKKVLENLLINGIVKNQDLRIKNEKQGHAPLFTLLISPTMRCNLKCVGCYAVNYQKQDDLPFEIFDRIIKEGKEMGVAFFTILGGEPLVYKDIFKIFEKHSDAYFHVYTNGTLVNDDICKKLAKLGNVGITFSIEGFEEETSVRRGAGVYKKIMDGMDLMQKYGIPHGYSVCVTKKNIEKIASDEFVDLMIKKGCVLGWYFLYMPVGGDKNLDLMPSPKQRLYLKKRMDNIRKNKPILTVDFWNDAPLVGGCIAGKLYAHVNNSGDVEPCIFTHYSQANVKNISLMDALDKPFYKELRKIQPYNENLYMPCMLIDNPKVFRDLHKKYKDLKPTHPDAENFVNCLQKQINEYSREMKKIYDPIWKKEKAGK